MFVKEEGEESAKRMQMWTQEVAFLSHAFVQKRPPPLLLWGEFLTVLQGTATKAA